MAPGSGRGDRGLNLVSDKHVTGKKARQKLTTFAGGRRVREHRPAFSVVEIIGKVSVFCKAQDFVFFNRPSVRSEPGKL